MTTLLETPSRIWRRIEAIEHRDMPSLPSLPPFEDSEVLEDESQGPAQDEGEDVIGNARIMSSPMQSTPSTQYTITSSQRGSTTTITNSSTARFAHSIASRSNQSAGGITTKSKNASFDIPSLPVIHPTIDQDSDEEGIESRSSVPDIYLPPEGDEELQESRPDFSLADALGSISREVSPLLPEGSQEGTPKNYGHSLSLKSEPKPSPLEKYRHVALRRTNPRARTPSLTRTSSSGSSSSQATPRSNRSLSESHEASVAPFLETLAQDHAGDYSLLERDPSHDSQETRSMDITDVHISPPRLDADADALSEDAEASYRERNDSNSQGAQEHEPTFSSEEDPTPYAINSKMATVNTSNVRSPSELVAFTPTPVPRPRARFTLPTPPSDLLSTPVPGSRNGEERDQAPRHNVIPATPYNRPSFLLSVINSTARPRLTAGTPHPQMFGTPSMAESTPAANNGSSSNSVNLRTAFSTIGRRPRIALAPRLSHPLSQAISASASSGSEAASPDDAPWATPSPYDGTTDKASFISTASSHDLTTHQRVNTSFDPAMGFGAGAPVGRFNANKLNNYLHGLNRRLQEENEVLVERLKELEVEKNAWTTSTNEAEISNRNPNKPSRRRSSIGTTLGDVEEDKAEEWLEEKAELEGMIEMLKTEVEVYTMGRQELETQLENEKEERERDKERWKERMMEVQEGVSGLVVSLEKKVSAAEDDTSKVEKEANRRVKEMANALAEAEGQRDIATERALKAEKFLEGEKDLGAALVEANEWIARIKGDLKNASFQIKGLEDEVSISDSRIEELEKEVHTQKELIIGLESAAESRENVISDDHIKIKKLEGTIRQLDDQLHKAKDYAEAMEQGADDVGKHIHQLEEELSLAQETIHKQTALEQQNSKDVMALEQQLESARERERQMEEAVEVSEEKLTKDEELILDLRNRLASFKRERQRDASVSSRSSAGIVFTAAEYEALENELDDANREKAKLRGLLDQSPARKAIEKAKDLKIELLEREKEELLERNRTLRLTVNEIGTPNKLINASGISPIHRHVLSMSIRMPKTPGTPLRDLSWLNSTQHDSSLTPLVTEIRRLQGELDRANESIDDKLDKLENAGVDAVSLTQMLEDARTKMVALEDEIADLKRKEGRRTRRLARARCQKCHIKLDLENLIHLDESSINVTKDSFPAEPPTPPTRTSESLKANLQAVNGHLDELKKQWETEKSRLLGEKAMLQDAANRLNTEVKNTKSEAKKASEGTRMVTAAKANVQNELSKAKETIAVLEEELSSERSRLRSMVAEQERMHHEKKRILTEMQRNESDIEEVKQQMTNLRKENQKLEKELRENATAEQKARLLETRVVENVDTIEHLRQERNILVNEHKGLQRRFKDATDVANNLRTKCTSLSTAHDNRRNELDMHRLEIEELRRALEDRASDLQRMEREKEKASSEKDNVAGTVAGLEADLQRVKRDAEAFGMDLQALRAEKENLETRSKDEIAKAERAKKQAQAQIRILTEQLNAEKDRASKAIGQLENRVSVVDEDQLSKLKIQHNKECKGLIVQIHYLKAKFTRESLFREDMTYQKRYLLVLLRQFEKSERNIFAAIARIGFPVALPTTQKRKRKLKSVVCALTFLSRMKKSSNAWNQESSAKKLVAAALEDVRKGRLANS